jgi:hypothetical protein
MVDFGSECVKKVTHQVKTTMKMILMAVTMIFYDE